MVSMVQESPKFENINDHTYKIGYFDYVLVLSSLLITASPFFGTISILVDFTFMMLIWAYALYRKKMKNSKRIFLVLIAVYALIVIQFALYGGFSPAAIYKPMLLFFTPYILYRLFGVTYFKYLFWIIYYGAIISFPIWLLQCLIPAFDSILQKYSEIVFPYNWDNLPRSLLFYTITPNFGGDNSNLFGLLRNSGFFHEPGAFSIYLMLAIIINTFNSRNTLDKKNIILAIILLTTFSTAGYILLIMFLAYAIPKSKLHTSLKFIIFLIMIIATIKIYTSQDFLQKKIGKQYSSQVTAIQKNEVGGGRFFAFLKAYEIFKQNIFFGKGIINANRPISKEFKDSGFGWGFMGFLAFYGIFFGVFYLLFFYKGLKKLCFFYGLPKGLAILFILIIHAGLSTQSFFFHASFVMFFIVGLESNVNLNAFILPKKVMLNKT